MDYGKEILDLIHSYFNAFAKGDTTTISNIETSLNNISNSDKSPYLEMILTKIIFSQGEDNFRIFSAIVLFRRKILKTESIINQYLIQLCQPNNLFQNIVLNKFSCLAFAQVIKPSQIDFILNYQPNFQILFILYYYIQDKLKSSEGVLKFNEIFNYIKKYSLFNPNKVEIATIAVGILTSFQINDNFINDDSYTDLITTMFEKLPAKLEYLPIFCELINGFDEIPDSEKKLIICITQLNQLWNIEINPHEKNILDHNISVKSIADCFIRFINYYIDDEDNADNFFTKDIKKVLQIAIRFGLIQDYTREQWMNNIDDYFIDSQYDFEEDDSGQDLIRCHTLSLINTTMNFTTFYNLTSQIIKETIQTNPILASRIEEFFYYVIFSFIKDCELSIDLLIPPPINPQDILLCGGYIKCVTALGKPLEKSQYQAILNEKSHFILKICLAQGLATARNISIFPNELFMMCIKYLIQMIDQFQTDADVDLFELIGNLVIKTQMNLNDVGQILLILKDKWIKHMNNNNLILQINSIISDFTNFPNIIPIILNIFLPLLNDSFKHVDFLFQSISLLQVLTKKLPIISDNSIQIPQNIHMNILSAILTNCIIPISSHILSGKQSVDIIPESVFSILAFYCRISAPNPIFRDLILFTIEKLNEISVDNFIIFGKNFVSFVYEFFLIKTNENIGKNEIIQRMIQFFTIPNNNVQIYEKKNMLLLILALYCTKDPESFVPLFNNSPFFDNIIFQFMMEHFTDFTTEERCIYSIMYFSCVRMDRNLYNNDMYLVINDEINNKLKYLCLENDTCYLLDRSDPFISNHPLVNISKEIFCNYFVNLLSQLK